MVERGQHIALWFTQGLLAVFFGLAGAMHGVFPVAEVAKSAPWADDVPVALLRSIGVAELAGAVGVIVPAVMRARSPLTAWAALGLMTIMLLAAVFHLSRGEPAMIVVNLAVAAMAAFVAWGRWPRRAL
jgi:putative oxidoreductase